jgi:arylamine N-acetyltransferase
MNSWNTFYCFDILKKNWTCFRRLWAVSNDNPASPTTAVVRHWRSVPKRKIIRFQIRNFAQRRPIKTLRRLKYFTCKNQHLKKHFFSLSIERNQNQNVGKQLSVFVFKNVNEAKTKRLFQEAFLSCFQFAQVTKKPIC